MSPLTANTWSTLRKLSRLRTSRYAGQVQPAQPEALGEPGVELLEGGQPLGVDALGEEPDAVLDREHALLFVADAALGVRGAAGVAEGREHAEVPEDATHHRALLEVAREGDGEGAGQGVRPAVVGRQDALRRRLRAVVAAHLVHDPRAVVDVGERIGAGVLGLLEGVGDGAVEVVAEPPVQPDVEPADVAEVQVGQDPEVVVAAAAPGRTGETSRAAGSVTMSLL